MSFACDCLDFEQELPQPQQHSHSADEEQKQHPVVSRLRLLPCEHVGALLLVLRKIQCDAERKLLRAQSGAAPSTPVAATAAAATSCNSTLFVSPERKLSLRQVQLEVSLRKRVTTYSLARLRLLLELNKQSTSGARPALVDRVVDGMLRGALPPCPRCRVVNGSSSGGSGGGQLAFVAHKYRCVVPGCSFPGASSVKRTPWIES
jgi:hypothetical protein